MGVPTSLSVVFAALLEIVLGDGLVDGDGVTCAGFQFHPTLGIGVEFLNIGTVFTGIVGRF